MAETQCVTANLESQVGCQKVAQNLDFAFTSPHFRAFCFSF
jgi:hypothetical protein